MRIAVPDLVSNSYFPVIAADRLGAFAALGLDLKVEHISPLPACVKALADGAIDFIGASAHAPLLSFPDWQGARLVCAQSQGMYWFLVMRADLRIARGDLGALRGRRIAAVPFVGAALRRLLIEADLDPAREGIDILVPPGALGPGVNFGVAAALALREGSIDGFFANGMGAALALEQAIGTIVIDVRRGDGPAQAFSFTQPAIATTEQMIAEQPDVVRKVQRAIIDTHAALKRDRALATKAVKGLFPAAESALIGDLIVRDLPYYDARITPGFVQAMNRFASDLGMLSGCDFDYGQVVAAL